jgi:hypothetical protein
MVKKFFGVTESTTRRTYSDSYGQQVSNQALKESSATWKEQAY